MKKFTIIIFSLVAMAALTLLSGCGFKVSQNNPAAKQPVANNTENSVWKTYSHPGYGFSFDHPADWTVSSFSQGDGEMVLVQMASSSQGFQIYILPFDEPETTLTKQRILQDIPDMVIEQEKEITIAGSVSALSFSGNDASFGKTYEIWFAHDSMLYQIMAGAENQDVLDTIINTFKFN